MKKFLVPVAFSTLLLSACQASVTTPTAEENAMSSEAVVQETDDSMVKVEVDAAGTVEEGTTMSEGAADTTSLSE